MGSVDQTRSNNKHDRILDRIDSAALHNMPSNGLSEYTAEDVPNELQNSLSRGTVELAPEQANPKSNFPTIFNAVHGWENVVGRVPVTPR